MPGFSKRWVSSSTDCSASPACQRPASPPTEEDLYEKFTKERPVKAAAPLDSTHLNGSFQASWSETFDLPTIYEDQFEDIGEANSPSIKRSSPYRSLERWQSSGDLSGLDGDGSCCSCSESSEKISFLEDRVSELESDSLKLEETARRQRNINKRLIKRVHSLEESVQLEKIASEDSLEKLQSLHKISQRKAERAREVQVDNLNTSVHMLQEENYHLTRKLSALRIENRALEMKVDSLEDNVMELQESLQRLKQHAQVQEKLVFHERQAREQETGAMRMLIENLQKQLSLPCIVTENEGLMEPTQRHKDKPVQIPSQEDLPTWPCPDGSNRDAEQQNLRLQAEVDELQEALSAQGRALLLQQSREEDRPPALGSDFCSLVDEMELSNREQIQALQEEKEINRHLRQYLDKVILTILEKDPTLLEVKHPA